ncbi:MAG: PAS domain S-box protein [Bacteroidota bacterium]|nr:PAS domain S-box protein [Bacteroidota bacterium]
MAENIFQFANDAVFIIDLEGVIRQCNDIVERFYGYRSDELPGKPFSLLLPPGKITEFETHRENLVLGTISDAVDTERITRNKDIIKVSASYSPIKEVSGTGQVIGISVIERKVSYYRTIASKAQALLETSPDPLVIINSSGQILFINAQTELLFGYKKEELLGRKVEKLMPDRFLESHNEYRKDFFSHPKTRNMNSGLELFAKRKDGTEFPAEISLSPLTTEEGVFVSAAIRDITERKRAEEKFRGLLEAAPDAMIIANEKGEIVLVNHQTEILFGYSKNELINRPVELLMPGNLRGKHEGHRAEYYKEPKVRAMGAGIELFAIRKDGTQFPVEISLSPLETSEGILVSAAVRDITERKKSEQKFRGLLESAPDAIVIVDRQGVIQLINAQTEQLFGYKREELMGHKVEILIPGRFVGNHPEHRENFFSNPKTRSMGLGLELFGKKKNGAEFPVEISLSPMETAEGLLVSAAIRDISEKKQLEKQIREANINLEKKVQQRTAELERKNKDLEQFAYVASHDLQEPLRTTSSFVELFSKKYMGRLDADADKMLNYMVQASDRMRVLIQDLLDYSRIGRKTDLQVVDCSAMIKNLLVDLDKSIQEINAIIHVEELPVLKAYPTELKLLFQNLILNSIKFRRKNVTPEITIGAIRSKNAWQFAIEDNGIGIEEKYRERIFVIFQRLHTRSEYEGSGIGLAHCKKIAELHGGNIWVESARNQGCIFNFTIADL